VTNQDVQCPKCGTEFAITEALARPIVEAERNRLEAEMRQRSTALQVQEEEIQSKRQQLEAQQKKAKADAAAVEKFVQERLETERVNIAAVEAKRIEGNFRSRLEAARRDQEAKEARIAEMELAELEFRKGSEKLGEQKRQLELTMARQLDEERERIRREAVAQEQKRNEAALAAKDGSLAELEAQLTESRRFELDLRKQREALDEEKKILELEVMRRLDEERERVRDLTLKQEEGRNRLKLAEKDKIIDDTRRQIEELRRKIEQGSQQLQGEIQELELEAILRSQFPGDEFQPVAVGRAGADLIQKVIGARGVDCGTILWEAKRTKAWQDVWLSKARENQRSARASLCVIASTALPKGLTNFDRVEDVWLTSFDCVISLAKALRGTLIQTNLVQVSGQDRSSKTDRIYSYITGQDFKHRVCSIVEAYVTLQEDLERERRSVTAAWARRGRSHDQIMLGVAGMYGDLHGIIGKSMPEIESLEAVQLDRDSISLPKAELKPLQLKR